MADPIKVKVTVGEKPIKVHLKRETYRFQTPLIYGNGWPFGTNPNFVENIPQGTETLIDRVLMPGKYRLVKWLLVVSDDKKSKGISCEINAFVTGSNVEHNEFAILGDVDELFYRIETKRAGEYVELYITVISEHIVNARTVKVGIFN
ncbi:MAG: hypothetical protein HQL74_12565 [Magnetococcales bacterium]|nr:hypothetical protein [Magnetococcales bacterium]